MEKVHSRPHDKGICGAKTRAGTPCQQRAGWGTNHVGKGRCKLHGGKSTGPKDGTRKSKDMKNNKNGVTTHERESIVFDHLEGEEKELLKQIDLDELKQIDNEIKLTDIRLRRMMGRIAKLQESNMVAVETSEKTVPVDIEGNTITSEVIEKKQDSLSQIQNIEDAITRVQSQKLRLIKTKSELETNLGIETEYKQIQIDKLKAQIEKIKGISDDIEDTSELRKLLGLDD